MKNISTLADDENEINLATNDFLSALFTMYYMECIPCYNISGYLVIIYVKFICDFTLCFESIIIMIILSYDRILLVRGGTRYFQKETKKQEHVLRWLSWVISFLLYSPAIILMDLWNDVDILADEDCDTPFAQDFIFTTVTAVCEFVIPLFLISSRPEIRENYNEKPEISIITTVEFNNDTSGTAGENSKYEYLNS
ncbi:LOW QUALITY PROTEIN: hypothetical protein KUTeg_012843 [Tegillarca granosa]|uniref:G-protein coupled receptors family 1 profile domain-containing protein n=1 Tax=Tegillarca granosa TaxID=220873 RepID=A0ABQ9EWN5_TEGGR|nr:LOW QUALITY PROTEIN: hypothetical protein KUTeg_012843 [Tegillarca granosa]